MRFHFANKASQEIRSDAERDRAAAQVEFFRAAIEKLRGAKPTQRNAKTFAQCQEMLQEREAKIRDYESLRRGELRLPKVERLDQISSHIPRIRIAKGISQTELARRLGVSKQVVSRYEESDYQTVGVVRLQEILDALGVEARIRLGA